MSNIDRLYMVFDVESVGLHGEGYAAGFVVINGLGNEVQFGTLACKPDVADGTDASRVWIHENIPPITVTHRTPREIREVFWRQWISWKQRGAILVADCPWPVEARFLRDCVSDNAAANEWSGPYPFIDIASVILAKGGDPLAKFGRLPSELPIHDPTADARQSARIFIEHLNK